MKLLVTGGAGFIGSALVRHIVAASDDTVINVDKLTYAGNLDSLAAESGDSRHIFEKVDICDASELRRVFMEHGPDGIIHLAAESHVDRSIYGPAEFVNTNVVGTSTLLEVAREYWLELESDKQDAFRFLHVSTDEVYGDLGPDDPAFTEQHAYKPSSPYAASKAASDHLVRAWNRTYELPIMVTNCSNNYGPYQFPEKLIPLIILNALDGKALPVYGTGNNVRDWLFVDDHARALRQVYTQGSIGRTYNIGGRSELSNIDVVRQVCSCLDEFLPRQEGVYEELIEFVADRPGHDLRYAIDDRRIYEELGWSPEERFESGLVKTVRWYLDNGEWIRRVRTGEYRDWIRANYQSRG